ncbi:MAG: 2-oxoglutarate dehydrogenase E1 component, partial [Deltaproteobacteria bacterium]|nr:2-oxoglutarate dehydrogenase E1 component [Deltaproteobacteria bacterium]
VDRDWRAYFAALNGDFLPTSDVPNDSAQPSQVETRRAWPNLSTLQEQLNEMIKAYRTLGHKAAQIDPLGLEGERHPALDPKFYGFTADRMNQLFPCAGMSWNGPLILREIVERLRRTYCGTLGVEYMHIDDPPVRDWLQRLMEESQNRLKLNREEQVRILSRLTDAVTFEEFIRKKFVGAKSFSLEGAESLIPLLDLTIEQAARDGVREIVVAMAHRGRLNVLANIIGKNPWEIFREFDDPPVPAGSSAGDVKYHLGYSNDYATASAGKVHLSLCFNPSHLEFVNPVALGRMRAKQDRSGDQERRRGMAMLIHGDAAFAAEGIVQEILNISQLDGYTVGGVLHVVINNQIGFTTSPKEARSSRYATDVVKMLQIPVFHVNGDDPEAVAQAVRLAMNFRLTFKRDAVIDLYCYRRLGHNEGDEPTFTQPKLYQAIAKHRPVRELYLNRLLEGKIIDAGEAERFLVQRRAHLEKELARARGADALPEPQSFGGLWAGYAGGLEAAAEPVHTAVDKSRLSTLLDVQMRFPEDFQPHPKIKRALELRREMAQAKRPVDWSSAEALAFASLAMEGIRIRLSGQDSARGTFSQRHAVLRDYNDGHPYVPLQHLQNGQAPVDIYNSPLSEAGVLGFEYGYSLDYPDGLVLWEAQFGDFVNAAQVIIDQFLTSAEEKWRRLSGLVLLLPHGFEGMGPEHSSARIERFLQLCAKDNIQVVYPTTPAQYFHCLRRQALRRWRKPLVVMTPKSLLRHSGSFSALDMLANGEFETVIADTRQSKEGCERVILCSGKIYYDLEKKRAELQRDDVAIVRVEQFYPMPENALRAALESYAGDTPMFWVQEEPRNMGAACFWHLQLGAKLFDRFPFSVIARAASASPATGSARRHQQQQTELLNAAFGTDR